MSLRPPRSTRTDSLFPYTTLFRSAKAVRPDLIRMNAADFVEAELAKPQTAGTTRVLMHSIVWQYVPEDQQMRVTAAMEAAGARATPDRPLAWIALGANRPAPPHALVVRHRPEQRRVGQACGSTCSSRVSPSTSKKKVT